MKVLLSLISFFTGACVGWYGFYRYSNHLYLQHPEFFKARLERKIEKRQSEVSA